MYKQSIYRIGRLLLIIAVVLLGYFFLRYALPYIYPLIVAFILSFFINPVVTLLERKLRLPRALATIIVLVAVFTVIVSSIVLIISEFIQGTTYLANVVPPHFNTFVGYISMFLENHIVPLYRKLADLLHTLHPEQQQVIQQHIQEMASNIATTGTTTLQHLLLKIPAVLKMLPASFAIMIFIVLASFFIVKDWPIFEQRLQARFPGLKRDSTRYVWSHLKGALFGFIKAQIILISISAIIILIGLEIIRVDHALTIALIASAVDLLPYVGTGIIFIPWIIYQFLSGSYPMTISLSVLYMIVVVTRQFIEPKLMSTSIGVHPLPLLIAVFLGLQLWGMLGLLIAPLIVVLGTALGQAGVFQQLWAFVKG